MQTWQLQEAKAHMSELVKMAQSQPQEITLHGKPVAVLLSRETFEHLSQQQESLVSFMRRSPLWGEEEVNFKREAGLTREISF
jgi:prevent-host-death family protein